MKTPLIICLFASFFLISCGYAQNKTKKETTVNTPLQLTDEEWKAKLTPEEYEVLRNKGTERPRTGEYDQHWDAGTYVCKACGAELFKSETKFDASCGWPSFYKSVDKSKIIEEKDVSFGMVRTEVMCANCGGHLGHVFDDGPNPTGLRYCINSVSLGFKKAEK
jgi:peptide-methionine (R)-S-oxide reductase